jgi:DNA-binding response OmpR family regulator
VPGSTLPFQLIIKAAPKGSRSPIADPAALVCWVCSNKVRRGAVEVVLPALQMRMLMCLMSRAPALVTFDELIQAVWGDQRDGGPLNAAHTVKRSLVILKPAALLLGLQINNWHGQGYSVVDLLRAAGADLSGQSAGR